MANFQGKVSDDLYDRLEQLKSEAGGTHAEFLERMANAYELHKVKQGDNLLSSEVEELESLTARINRIMINANEKINSALRDKDLSNEEKQSANEELIARLRKDLESLKESNKVITEQLTEATKNNTELTLKLQEAEEQSTLAKDLVAEYKEKNDNLTSIIAEYKQDRETNKQLVSEISTLKEKLSEVENKANSEMQKVESLIKEKEKMQQDYSNKVVELQDKHKQALEQAEALKDIEVSKAALKAKEDAQTKIDVCIEKQQELRDKIDNMQETINVYTVSEAAKDKKIESLIKEIESLKKEVESLQKELKAEKKTTK